MTGAVEATEANCDNCDTFKQSFRRQLETGDRKVVLDASRIGFFDSAGMSALLFLQKSIEQSEGQLVLVGLNRSVSEVFRMVGFDAVFKTFPDVSTAASSFEE